MIKIALRILIDRFGLDKINDIIAQIFDDKFEQTNDPFYDELSASYDKINYDLLVMKRRKC